MADHIIVGAGPSGLFTAYRLLRSGMKPGDTVKVFEWSPTAVGGRISTYTFQGPGTSGQYCEVGGMRFATDVNFPQSIQDGHVVLQNLIVELGMAPHVVPFIESDSRLYYLRGLPLYEDAIIDGSAQPPYHFNRSFKARYAKSTADMVLADLTNDFVGSGSGQWTRQRWCDYFSTGTVPASASTSTFPAGTPIRDIGYWNLLYAQLGDEGFDYIADANGYTSNVINWSSADAMQANTDFGSGVGYSRLAGGYGTLFTALRDKVLALAADYPGSGIFMGHRLRGFYVDESKHTFTCGFTLADGSERIAKGHSLFLAMPRQSLDLVAQGCMSDNPLRQDAVRYYLESSIDQPSFKVAMLFDQAWWADPSLCTNRPHLTAGVGGPTITDLPLRQVYYFGNNAPNPGSGGPYVLLASYDDMQNSAFWRELEITGDRNKPLSADYQPLTGPTHVPPEGPMVQTLLSQLAEVHGTDPTKIPQPLQTVYQDWGLNPFGGGYHGWAAHYDICEAMNKVRAPARSILGKPLDLYIIGSCYSFDQAWVEGALCVAESVLEDFLGLAPFCALPPGYVLVPEAPRTPQEKAGAA